MRNTVAIAFVSMLDAQSVLKARLAFALPTAADVAARIQAVIKGRETSFSVQRELLAFLVDISF